MTLSRDELSYIKIIDFGLAKSIVDKSGSTKGFKGSIFWMSPEAFEGKTKEPKSDIWSLGATIIEMVSF